MFTFNKYFHMMLRILNTKNLISMRMLQQKGMRIKAMLFLVLSFITPFSLGFSQKASAQRAPQTQDSGRTGIVISPPTYELTSNPGDKIENVIKVTSQSPNIVNYEALVEDFSVEGTEGAVSVREDPNPKAFSKWFSISPTTFELKPNETKNIKFTITVPNDGEPGGHFASVLFQPKAIGSNNATGAQVLQRVGALVLMTVSGAVTEKGSVIKLSPKNYSGSWEEIKNEEAKSVIYSPRDENLNNEKTQSFFNEGPVGFDLVLKNEGNVFYKPKGTMTIYNIFGRKVDEITIEPKNVFPGGERRITVIWPKKNLWGVRYTAKVVTIYGSKSQTMTAETSFWAFPVSVAIGIGLLILLLLRKRLIKAISIIAKG
jgi:hypothetical protein